MQYFTRLQESPSVAILAMLKVNPTSKVAVLPMEDRYGRAVAVRTLRATAGDEPDAVFVCAGDNPVFVANVIVLAHAHNVTVDGRGAHNGCDGF
jgi:hypothetical protein